MEETLNLLAADLSNQIQDLAVDKARASALYTIEVNKNQELLKQIEELNKQLMKEQEINQTLQEQLQQIKNESEDE